MTRIATLPFAAFHRLSLPFTVVRVWRHSPCIKCLLPRTKMAPITSDWVCVQSLVLAADDIKSVVMRVPVAVGETFILLHPLLPLVGVSIEKERGCQQNDSLADG